MTKRFALRVHFAATNSSKAEDRWAGPGAGGGTVGSSPHLTLDWTWRTREDVDLREDKLGHVGFDDGQRGVGPSAIAALEDGLARLEAQLWAFNCELKAGRAAELAS